MWLGDGLEDQFADLTLASLGWEGQARLFPRMP